MHGESQNGNEGFILMYNPNISPKSEIKIDVVDVAPTLASHLLNIDIPSNSMGVTKAYFGVNKTGDAINSLKKNLRQLQTAAVNKGKKK